MEARSSQPDATAPRPHLSSGLSLVPFLIFLVAFGILLLAVVYWYLLPALHTAAATTNPATRRQLAAHGALVMVLVLFATMVLLFLSFRIHRLFSPKPKNPVHTEYPDAWEESARRVKLDDEKDDQA